MLRTTKSLALAVMIMLSVMTFTEETAHAAAKPRQQTKPAPTKPAPTKNVRKVTPPQDNAAKLYVQKVNAFIKDSR